MCERCSTRFKRLNIYLIVFINLAYNSMIILIRNWELQFIICATSKCIDIWTTSCYIACIVRKFKNCANFIFEEYKGAVRKNKVARYKL